MGMPITDGNQHSAGVRRVQRGRLKLRALPCRRIEGLGSRRAEFSGWINQSAEKEAERYDVWNLVWVDRPVDGDRLRRQSMVRGGLPKEAWRYQNCENKRLAHDAMSPLHLHTSRLSRG
jgi:hypothetical protein